MNDPILSFAKDEYVNVLLNDACSSRESSASRIQSGKRMSRSVAHSLLSSEDSDLVSEIHYVSCSI